MVGSAFRGGEALFSFPSTALRPALQQKAALWDLIVLVTTFIRAVVRPNDFVCCLSQLRKMKFQVDKVLFQCQTP